MKLLEKLLNKERKIAVVGLGYVGMPLAIEFARKLDVIGFDISQQKINLYKQGIDPTTEVGNQAIRETNIEFTTDASKLEDANFIIVAVPTPVNIDKTPNLEPIKLASKLVGEHLKRDSIVVYESTVYPGVTEEICLPVLEKASGLKCGVHFKIGYSPERINPSDREHVLINIVKVVSGIDQDALDEIASVYELIVKAGVYRASSIRVAEAAKVIENSQRDINIAFMNELSIIFHKLRIDTKEVLEAANTKWNFLKFQPGLVGGHCIGVDPYYLTHKAEQVGYHSQVILAGRRINDDMGKYIAENIVKTLIKSGKNIKDAKVAILGFTFKENCQDTRNTKVIDIVNELNEYGVCVTIADDIADKVEAQRLYGVNLVGIADIEKVDAIVVSVQHDIYKKIKREWFDMRYIGQEKLLFDIKGIYDRDEYEKNGYIYWRL